MNMTEKTLLERAYDFAAEKHKDHKRKYTGKPYITHLINVARTVTLVTDNQETIAAALLHDTVEDTATTHDEIREHFGDRVAELVFALTDVDHTFGNRATRKALDRARLADAPAAVQTIKLADLIDNTVDIMDHDPHKFGPVYLREKRLILEVLTKGDPKLFAEAKRISDSYLTERE